MTNRRNRGKASIPPIDDPLKSSKFSKIFEFFDDLVDQVAMVVHVHVRDRAYAKKQRGGA